MGQGFGIDPTRKFSLPPKVYLPVGKRGSAPRKFEFGIFTEGIQSNDFYHMYVDQRQ